MLRMEADAVTSAAFVNSLALVKREMELVVKQLMNIGTEAALLAGFSFIIFKDSVTSEIRIDNEFMSMLSIGSATTCFTAATYSVVCATFSCSHGPMLALKGNDPSAMRRAVQEMKHDRRRIMYAFMIGMATFEFLGFVLLWNQLLRYFPSRIYNAVICSTLMLIAAICLIVSVHSMLKKYGVDETVGLSPTALGATPRQQTGEEYLDRVSELRHAEGITVAEGRSRTPPATRVTTSTESWRGRSVSAPSSTHR